MIQKNYKIFEDNKWKDIALREDANGVWEVRIGNKTIVLEPLMVKPPMYTFRQKNGEIVEIEIHPEKGGDDSAVNYRHYPYRFHLVEPMRVSLEESDGGGGKSGGKITAPMPGKVVEIKVKVGDAVEAGQGVIVVEAMKMQNELVSEVTGTVSEILVTPSQTVEGGQTLVVIK